MIQRISYYKFVCELCDYIGNYSSYSLARNSGWCITRSRDKCYCPNCAPQFRHVGTGGSPVTTKEDIFRIKYGF